MLKVPLLFTVCYIQRADPVFEVVHGPFSWACAPRPHPGSHESMYPAGVFVSVPCVTAKGRGKLYVKARVVWRWLLICLTRFFFLIFCQNFNFRGRFTLVQKKKKRKNYVSLSPSEAIWRTSVGLTWNICALTTNICVCGLHLTLQEAFILNVLGTGAVDQRYAFNF